MMASSSKSTGGVADALTVVVGLNGALQKRFVLPSGTSLVPGDVHRADKIQSGLGGKGQDVAVTLSCLEYSAGLKIAQFVGAGAEGEAVREMLEEKFGSDALDLTVRTASGMRTCTSIVSDESTTELVEPSGVIEDVEMDTLLEKLSDCAAKKKADALCIMGSMPPGCSEETYADIYQRVAGRRTLCLVDSVAGLKPLLKRMASSYSSQQERGPVILKCNASELCRLAGVNKPSGEADGVKQEELIDAIAMFLKTYPDARRALTAIALTDGAHPSYLAFMPVMSETEFRLFQLPVTKLALKGDGGDESMWGQWTESQQKSAKPSSPPKIFPIGAGDSVAAGTLAAWKVLTADSKSPSRGPATMNEEAEAALAGNESPATRAILAAFSFGLACGTASCLNEENSVVKVSDVLEIFKAGERPHYLSSHSVSS